MFGDSYHHHPHAQEIADLRHQVRLLHDSVLTLTTHVLRKDHEVATDLTKLTNSVVRLEAAVANLPPGNQAETDALADRVDVCAQKLEPVPTPAPTPTP